MGAILIVVALVGSGSNGSGGDVPRREPMTDEDFAFNGNPPQVLVDLGKALFYDKILSGNLNISCATCHHGHLGTGDSLSLPVGEGGRGLGIQRDTGEGADAVLERVPRNAPPVFNLGHLGITDMFHDGRVAVDPSQPSGFLSPAGDDLPMHLASVLAAQAMFPVTSATEMAGQAHENLQGNLAAAGNLPLLWDHIATKVAAVPLYVAMFLNAYYEDPDIPVRHPLDITYVHIANAIAAFETSLRADRTPYDFRLNKDWGRTSHRVRAGMDVFFKKGCSDCHMGPKGLLTDMKYHAIAMPQIGPGKGDGPSGREDFGRERVTGDPADRYKFRTPPLRNVALTAPYGHSGAFATLEAVVRHHLDPVESLFSYEWEQATLPSRTDLDAHDLFVKDSYLVEEIAAANELEPRRLTENQILNLLEFLTVGLTDPRALDIRSTVPLSVPSGLPVRD